MRRLLKALGLLALAYLAYRSLQHPEVVGAWGLPKKLRRRSSNPLAGVTGHLGPAPKHRKVRRATSSRLAGVHGHLGPAHPSHHRAPRRVSRAPRPPRRRAPIRAPRLAGLSGSLGPAPSKPIAAAHLPKQKNLLAGVHGSYTSPEAKLASVLGHTGAAPKHPKKPKVHRGGKLAGVEGKVGPAPVHRNFLQNALHEIERFGGEFSAPKPFGKAPKGFHAYRGKFGNTATDEQLLHSAPAKGAAFALHQTLRPIHGIAGGIDAALQHKDVGHAIGQGFLHNKPTSFSDVLRHAGVKNKTVQHLAGLGLDVLADPTTYATFGSSAVAKTAAKEAAEGARVGLHAHVPGTNLTGDIGVHIRAPKTVRKAGQRIRSTRPVQGAGEALAPDFRPAELSHGAHRTIRRAERRYRAAQGVAERKAVKHAHAIKKAAPKLSDQHAITDAIEAGKISLLPERLKSVAHRLDTQFGEEFQAKHVRGLLDEPYRPKGPGDAERYFPHANRVQFERKGGRVGAGRIKVAPEHGRSIPKPLKQMRQEAPHVFEERLEKIAPHSALRTATKAGLHDLWKQVASAGRKLHPGAEFDTMVDAVYEVTPRGLKQLGTHGEHDLKGIEKAAAGGKGEYVILPRKVVDHIEDVVARSGGQGRTFPGQVFDRTQGLWKLAAISTPAYHARNLVGDSINAYLGDATARSFGQSLKGMKALHAREAARGSEAAFHGGRKLKHAEKLLSQQVRLGKAGRVTIGEELALAEREGAIRTGQAGHDVRELLGGDPKKLGRIRAVSEYREDFPRFATYLAARKRGLDPSAAAEWSLKHHFDYGDLTRFERTFARRAFPFYTFFARNTRLQATKLVQRPGKYATIAKALEETSKAMGFRDYESYVSSLPDYNQRGIPIPIKIGGKVFNVFISPPLTDLQQLTDVANPGEELKNFTQRLTFFKALPELVFNYSTFFRGPIQNDKSPLVPAPDALGGAPPALKRLLGVKKYRDKRTGKMIWGWPARVDYVARLLPQTGTATGALTSVKGSRGQSGAQQLIGLATGARIVQNRPLDNRINQLYGHKIKLQNQLMATEQRLRKGSYKTEAGYPTHYPQTPAIKRLKAQIKSLDQEIGSLRTRRGDPANELAPTQRKPKPKRARRRSPGGGDPFKSGDPFAGGNSDPFARP